MKQTFGTQGLRPTFIFSLSPLKGKSVCFSDSFSPFSSLEFKEWTVKEEHLILISVFQSIIWSASARKPYSIPVKGSFSFLSQQLHLHYYLLIVSLMDQWTKLFKRFGLLFDSLKSLFTLYLQKKAEHCDHYCIIYIAFFFFRRPPPN